MLIGLTGKNGAGKGEVAEFLKKAGYEFHSLSDVLREELKNRRQPVTRTNLIAIGRALRGRFGPGALAERILAKLSPERNAVIDSIRNPGEVAVLQRRPDFFLIAVDARPKLRFQRLKKRGRESDPKNFQMFLELERAETTSNDPSAQQLHHTIELADATLANNGTLENLHQKIRALVHTLVSRTPRLHWDRYFLEIAKVVALRSNCIKRKIAALIVKDRRIISTGYNGTPRGVRNCNEGGCPRCNRLGASGANLEECLCSHAEENAIVQAAYHGVNIHGATLYSTFSPCLLCTKMIINSGIKEVVYQEEYTVAETPLRLLKDAKVTIRRL